MSRLIIFVGVRQANNNDEVMLASGTSTESQRLHSPRSEITFQEVASSPEARSSDIGASTTLRTTVEEPQNIPEELSFQRPQRPIEHLAIPSCVNVRHITPFEADIDAQPLKSPQSMELACSNIIVFTPDYSKEASQIPTSSSHRDTELRSQEPCSRSI